MGIVWQLRHLAPLFHTKEHVAQRLVAWKQLGRLLLGILAQFRFKHPTQHRTHVRKQLWPKQFRT